MTDKEKWEFFKKIKDKRITCCSNGIRTDNYDYVIMRSINIGGTSMTGDCYEYSGLVHQVNSWMFMEGFNEYANMFGTMDKWVLLDAEGEEYPKKCICLSVNAVLNR